MSLIEKLDLLNLSEEERKKATGKFLISLALVSTDEIRDIVSYLQTQNVQITKAHELKLLTIPLYDITKKFDILSEIHETDIYCQNPALLCLNVIDIYKRIQYCKQNNKEYKNEDGTYKTFLFNEMAFQSEFNKKSDSIETSNIEVNIEPIASEVEEVNELPSDEEKIIDINDYINATANMDEDMQDLEAKTASFEEIRAGLQDQLAELDALKNMEFSDDEISFGDLEPESYGRGMAA